MTEPREIAATLDRLDEYRRSGRRPSRRAQVDLLDGIASATLDILDHVITMLGPGGEGVDPEGVVGLRNFWVVEHDLHKAIMGR